MWNLPSSPLEIPARSPEAVSCLKKWLSMHQRITGAAGSRRSSLARRIGRRVSTESLVTLHPPPLMVSTFLPRSVKAAVSRFALLPPMMRAAAPCPALALFAGSWRYFWILPQIERAQILDPERMHYLTTRRKRPKRRIVVMRTKIPQLSLHGSLGVSANGSWGRGDVGVEVLLFRITGIYV
jgi:hypothetical protein